MYGNLGDGSHARSYGCSYWQTSLRMLAQSEADQASVGAPWASACCSRTTAGHASSLVPPHGKWTRATWCGRICFAIELQLVLAAGGDWRVAVAFAPSPPRLMNHTSPPLPPGP